MFKKIILGKNKFLLLFFILLIVVFGFTAVGLIIQSANAENGNGEKEKMTICHFYPGNPDNYQTIEINASTWGVHQEHGDYLGECQEDGGSDVEIGRAIEEIDLSVSKIVNNSGPEAGSEITYTVTIENISGIEAKKIFVEDILPNGIAYQSSTASQGNYNQNNGRWSVGKLEGGNSAVLEITALVDEAFAGLTIENTASLTASNPEDLFDGNNYDNASITVSYITPVAHDDDYSVDEDNILYIEAPGPLANDEHIDQGVITAVVVANPEHGEINFNDSGEFIYTPDEDFNGVDIFTYEVCVDNSLCDTAGVMITVNSINDAPVANDDFATTMENEAVTVNVAHDDHDVDDNLDLLSLSVTINPSNGSVSVNQDGTVVYTPNQDFVGTDTFEYQICDTEGECAAASVEISVLESTGGITLVAVGDLITIDEDTEAVIAVLDNDLYNGSGVLSVQSILENPTHGSIAVNSDNTITYVPNQDFYGEDYFIYTVCDDLDPQNCAESNEVIIAINQVNDAPIANDDMVAIEQNEVTVIHATHDDIDVDNNLDETTLSIISNPANGTAEANIDGTITYTPNEDYIGNDEFTYQICDEDGSCDTAIVSISVTEATGAPTVVDDYATSFGEEIIIDVLANDSSVRGDLYVERILDEAIFGIAVLNNDNTITYTPNIGEYEDEIVYLACSEPDVCAQGNVFITVSEENHAIVIHDDVASVFKNQSVNIDILNNDIDPDHNLDPSSINIVSTPTNGTYQINNDGSVLYTPNQDFVGADSFTYNVCDEIGLCSETNAIVEITVVESSESESSSAGGGGGGGISISSPIGVNDKAGVFHGETLSLDVLKNDLPANSLFLFISRILYQPSHGIVEINDDNTISYTSDQDYIGDDDFSYVVCDSRSASLCSDAKVLIKVFENNTTPVVQDDFLSIHENNSASIDVLTNDFDLEENIDSETLKIISFPSNGTAGITGAGIITYTPNQDFVGSDELEYIVCDTKDKCDTANLALIVFAGECVLDTSDLVLSGTINTSITFSLSDIQEEGRLFDIHLCPLRGTLDLNDSGIHTYIPNRDFVGNDEFAYLVCSSENPDVCNEGKIEIVVFDSEDKIESKVEDDKKICKEYLKEYIKLGRNNNKEEVKKLQKFLIFYEDIKNAYISGIYDLFHFNLVLDFQKKYAEDILYPWGLSSPTGYVYKTTVKKINELYCAHSCHPYLTDYIKYGGKNDEKEVKKLQIFLRDYEDNKQIVESGVYDKTTHEAVLGFQKKYAEDILYPWGLSSPTGHVYKTTVKEINELYCSLSDE